MAEPVYNLAGRIAFYRDGDVISDSAVSPCITSVMDITPPPPPEPAKPKHKTPAEKRADERRKAVQQRYRWK